MWSKTFYFDQDMMRIVATMNWTEFDAMRKFCETISMENSDLVFLRILP